jgi:BirA family biotin operon repressor/biotin-[acetyl-CoA-carboxylase] ligase
VSPSLDPEAILAILHALADGEARPPAELAVLSGVDPEAIEASLETLADHGVRRRASGDLRVPGGIDLLSEARLQAALASRGPVAVECILRGVTGSTNDDARALLAERAPPFVVLAEAQRAGRGRRGRLWASPVASNLYLSIALDAACGARVLGGLSLAVGVAVAEAVEAEVGVALELKWPNDLLLEGRKLGGILVELVRIEEREVAIIGIGINVRQPAHVASAIDQPWADLASRVPAPISRNALAAAIIAATLRIFEIVGDGAFERVVRPRWLKRDAFADRPVTVAGPTLRIEGVARGIDGTGALLVETPEALRAIASGEVSLRARGSGSA